MTDPCFTEVRRALEFGHRQGWSPHHSTMWDRGLDALNHLAASLAVKDEQIERLEAALRYAVDCIESPDAFHEMGKDIYDASMMRKAIVRARAALGVTDDH